MSTNFFTPHLDEKTRILFVFCLFIRIFAAHL